MQQISENIQKGTAWMILGMIDLITHYETTLGAMEGQVLDDSKNTNITKEEDESCQFISIR